MGVAKRASSTKTKAGISLPSEVKLTLQRCETLVCNQTARGGLPNNGVFIGKSPFRTPTLANKHPIFW